MNPEHLFLWGHPRSLSTAMEVYFRTRGDFQVVHEPFADAYWKGTSAIKVLQELKLLLKTSEAPIFIKDIAHHLPKDILADEEIISEFTHVVLVRSPLAAFHSHLKVNPEVKPQEFGYQALFETLVQIQKVTGRTPYVLDADKLSENPAETIQKLCKAIGLEHRPEALRWQAKEQKDWRAAKKWQAKAAASTGFEQNMRGVALPALPNKFKEVFELHQGYYRKILAQEADSRMPK